MKEERGKVTMVSTVRPHCKQISLQKARENSEQRDNQRNFEQNDSKPGRKISLPAPNDNYRPGWKKRKKKPSITPTHHVLSKLGKKGAGPEAALRRVFERWCFEAMWSPRSLGPHSMTLLWQVAVAALGL